MGCKFFELMLREGISVCEKEELFKIVLLLFWG